MSAKRILVIDDDPETCEFLSEVFNDAGWTVETATNPDDATAKLDSSIDLIVSDVRLGTRVDGIELLKRFRVEHPRIPVILISGFGSLETAVESIREGAFDFISKPFNVEEVVATARRAIEFSQQSPDPRRERTADLGESFGGSALVGRSREMIALYKEIARVAPSRSTVLVTGESGTGKELVARAVHDNSPRAERPFVPVNCGALTETLLESELFGHQKGSFTGAVSDKKGLFEEADRGTIFLDEIGETSQALQVKLLRVLQEGEIRRVGGSGPIRVDVRVIGATNRDLEEEVRRGGFREDLFYRVSVVRLRVPPLRERVADIPALAAHFLKRACSTSGREVTLSEQALRMLTKYPWPGNVRELENTIEHLVLYSRDARITADDLPEKFREAAAEVRTGLADLFDDLPTLDELERRYMLHVLAAVNGNRTRAAETMGVDRRTLYRMAERFAIKLDQSG
ncbi:MAG: sigma-54-dependent Fis family transcriptional regulator [Acidobacteria bacterium]|nr:sigma-54-dependent Fis family transcriptional regulator [Acidobacteriota bacterium]